MAVVGIQEVRKTFGSVAALKGVSVHIEDGEFVALVGPSGCGKSTLLRLIAGLEDITGGQISIGGRVVNELTPRERNIAMVFQNYALYPHMTVTENMGFSMRLKKAPPKTIGDNVSRAAGILGLQALLERFPGQLSGGQRQRVAMGRAIVRDSKVFLFDEPLSNLDAQLRVQMRSEIKQLHQTLRNTMIYVTHDQVEAMTMADRIVVMRDGVIEQIGAPLDLYDRPANTFVASFIGSPTMNLIPGTVGAGGSGQMFAADTGAALPLSGAVSKALVGRRLVYGIRPENIAVAPDKETCATATLRLIEPTGSDTHLILDASGIEVLCAIRERMTLSPGQTIAIRPDPAKVHLFDEGTGERIETDGMSD
ncbi:MAG: sn-glycerol-3-phosphate ABC transporter ATP-binding protein UgpC [Roseitalea sp.]|nr:sn-glycerol-3-phosphate ABC transporter ATP-binding protein UgpC [Roseitalea sp.]MBO6720462.1 sn-glycerol-3-phosphate ABC transporter ATP-binding protein UgpC [Roseitalea sp.]MBO6743609.1 sn-glycerol-3-phosphate ABC transporter ATP-binding protein UgpC [Roseitalea sp.]